MLTGERRWISARRGGMTVLGKVTVPKPINLPSQRLENHGLDPSVEIVPKGTLNWGTRPPSSSQNAWASPAQSPPNIGGIDSANHLNGRPSSSGSGTRPSTAGSDRSHEPVPNVWGPSSRPSSASGVLTSNQTSVATARPRSAEPRPASSQLSRFAEPISENSVTWGASGTMEKLGISSSKAKDFALSSGDFPTLGSEKPTESIERQGHSSQGRPVSASGRASTPKQSEAFHSDDGSMNASRERGAVSSHEKNILEVEAGDQHAGEKWQRENNPYPTQNMPPQYGPWHGPPHGPPNGVWYRAPFAGPYGPPPGPPGSYCPDPFAYYHPRHPSHPAGNMQPVQPGSAPGGYYPDKGDSHRPHMPDTYRQPVMPYGPGPYPVQMPYDAYYGPPRVGSGIPNEQRPPVMGMPTPRGYNRYPVQNAHPDPATFHGSSGYGSSSTRAMEQGGPAAGQPHGSHQGPYKVLLKHQDGWDETDSRDKREHTVSTSLDRENLPGKPRDISQGMDLRHDEQGISTKVAGVASSQYAGSRGDHSPLERTNKVNRVEESSVRKSGILSAQEDDTQPKRNPTLIEKIESLNQKARMRGLSAKSDDIPNEAPITPIIDANPTGVETLTLNRRDASRPVHDPHISANLLNSSSGVALMQHDVQKRPHGRTDDRGKGRSNYPKAPVADLSAEGSEKPNLNQGKVGLGDESSALDQNEQQRAKVREMVAERAKRLQKEEEERTREQRARAQAKLDELNRRTLAETPTEKVENPLPQTVAPQHNSDKPEDNSLCSTKDESVTDANTPIQVMSSSASILESGIVNPSSWDCYTVVPSGWDIDPVEDEPDHTVTNKPIEVNRDDSNILKSKQHGSKKKHNVKRGDVEVNHFDPTNATTDESLVKHRKKNNRGKNKTKLDEVSSSVIHPPNKPPPISEPSKIKKTSVFEVGSVQVPFSIEIAEATQDSVVATIDQGEGSRSPTDHVVDSSNHHHHQHSKPHSTARRLPRNTQGGSGIRTAEKFHGSETTSTVVWAPVGSGKKQPEDAKVNTVETQAHPGRGVHKSKRAEMERYVPKPKEVSVQQAIPEQTSGNEENNVLPVVENKHNNNSKHMGKAHGLWRPRNSSEAPPPSEAVTDTGGYRGGRKPGLKGVVGSSEQETIEAASQWQPKSQSSQAAAPMTQGSTTTTGRGNGGQQRVHKKAPRKEYELSDASHDQEVEEMFTGPRQSRYGGGQNQRVQQQDNGKHQQRKYDAQYQYHQKTGGRSNNNGNEPPQNESLVDQGPPRGTGFRGQTQPRRGGGNPSYAPRGNNNNNNSTN